MTFRRSHRERDNAVHTDRQIVFRDSVRLQQRYINVGIRLHLFGHVQFDYGLLVVTGMFGDGQYLRPVFYADNGTASFG